MSPIGCPGWSVVAKDGVDVLTRTWKFDDWAKALAFVNQVGAVADKQDHHPLVELTWGRVTLFTWSHDVKGLTARDERFCTAVNAL
ncbi:MAG: 4a-hydroxytetrahydrobiopterin dehydratase [Deltaproteobacteria bacterium]|nr:4a-hydroxytetrahydrobiopterin dehydratase [Deltaproteobacteria bacterium]